MEEINFKPVQEPDQFNLETQYQMYLNRVGLDESMMPESQRIGMRQTFMGACGQMLVVFTQDIPQLTDEQAFEKLESMIDQVSQYFLDETFRHKFDQSQGEA